MLQKNIFIVLIILLSFSIADAQNFDTDLTGDPQHSLIIKASPQHFFWGGLPICGEFGLFAEKRVTQTTALEGGLAYVGKGLLLLAAEADTSYSNNMPVLGISGFRVQGLYKIYLNRKNDIKGFFVAPHFSYSSAKYFEKYSSSSRDAYIQGIHTDVGAMAGFRFAFGRFSLEPYLGGGYRHKHWITRDYTGVSVLTEEDIKDIYLIKKPFVLKMGLKLGLAF